MRRVRCFDHGDSVCDRYTIILLKKNSNGRAFWYDYFGCSAHPTHPQGFGQWGELKTPDLLGEKRITFKSLPDDVKKYLQGVL